MESTTKIKCHSSRQLFCRGDLCFLEYNELSPMKTDYGCLTFDQTIAQKCNKTIDSIRRECCSTTFCNSHLFNYEISHRYNSRWSMTNNASIANQEEFFPRFVLKIIVAIVLVFLLGAILIYLRKERLCQNIRSAKLQPSVSATTSKNTPNDKSIHLSTNLMRN